MKLTNLQPQFPLKEISVTSEDVLHKYTNAVLELNETGGFLYARSNSALIKIPVTYNLIENNDFTFPCILDINVQSLSSILSLAESASTFICEITQKEIATASMLFTINNDKITLMSHILQANPFTLQQTTPQCTVFLSINDPQDKSLLQALSAIKSLYSSQFGGDLTLYSDTIIFSNRHYVFVYPTDKFRGLQDKWVLDLNTLDILFTLLEKEGEAELNISSKGFHILSPVIELYQPVIAGTMLVSLANIEQVKSTNPVLEITSVMQFFNDLSFFNKIYLPSMQSNRCISLSGNDTITVELINISDYAQDYSAKKVIADNVIIRQPFDFTVLYNLFLSILAISKQDTLTLALDIAENSLKTITIYNNTKEWFMCLAKIKN